METDCELQQEEAVSEGDVETCACGGQEFISAQWRCPDREAERSKKDPQNW